MANFSLVSQAEISARVLKRIPLEMEVAITWKRFLPGLNFNPG